MASPREATSDKGPEASRRYPELFQRSCEVLKSLDWKDPGQCASTCLHVADLIDTAEGSYHLTAYPSQAGVTPKPHLS